MNKIAKHNPGPGKVPGLHQENVFRNSSEVVPMGPNDLSDCQCQKAIDVVGG